jgi:hypothetical protein
MANRISPPIPPPMPRRVSLYHHDNLEMINLWKEDERVSTVVVKRSACPPMLARARAIHSSTVSQCSTVLTQLIISGCDVINSVTVELCTGIARRLAGPLISNFCKKTKNANKPNSSFFYDDRKPQPTTTETEALVSSLGLQP